MSRKTSFVGFITLLICLSTSVVVSAAQPDPAIVGRWSSLPDLPYFPVHIHMLPTGKVLMWPGAAISGDDPLLWDPATTNITQAPQVGYDLFCTGETFLADGRLFVAGGTLTFGDDRGLTNASIYDPFSNSWTPAPNMNGGRYYPTTTTLANGDVLVVSGNLDNTQGVNRLPQVYEATSGTWRDLTNAQLSLDLYPGMHLAPNGKVFNSTPSSTTRYLDTSGTGAWTVVGERAAGYADYGSSVMYDNGKVLVMGGGIPPTNAAEVIDLNASTPSWRTIAPMAFARRQLNALLLPDGQVLVTGGTAGPGWNDLVTAVYAAEMWNPTTETWSTMASALIPRLYHSATLLLPDGRVLSTGGNDYPQVEVYEPPYLFKGARPTITAAPATVRHGETFFVSTADASGIAQVNWIALSSTTHTFNSNQRINRLSFSQVSGGLNVVAPFNPNLAPRGYYMLFILNGNGVPSVAKIVRLDATSSTLPVLTSLSPSSVTAGGSAFTLTVNGSNFISSSAVNWNGSPRATTLVNSTQVTATISATDIAVGGIAQVTVVNPAPGGGTSNALSFTITASGTTYLSDLAWVSATNGWGPVERDMSNGDLAAGDGVPLKIRGVSYSKGLGTHAASDITYALNGQYTTFLSDVGIDDEEAGFGSVVFQVWVDGVKLYDSGVVTGNTAVRSTTVDVTGKNTLRLVVTDGGDNINSDHGDWANARLVASAAGSLQFSSSIYGVAENAGNAVITITRTGGSAGTVGVTFSTSNGTATAGSDYTTTNQTVSFANGDSANKTVNVPILDDTIFEGNETINLTLSSPTGGATLGSPSAAVLTIVDNDNPVPALTSLVPGSATPGGPAFTLTVNGSNFNANSVVNWNGSPRVTTFFGTSFQLTAAIPDTDIASAGTAQVTVVNPAPGGGTSNALTFTINATNPVPALTSLSPSSATAGIAAFTLTVNGSDFISSSAVNWNGSPRTTTFVNSTQLTAAIAATDIASAGTAQVTVVNPAPGGGTSNALTFTINGSAGSLQFSSSTYSVNENGGSATITITRAGGSAGAVGVTFSTSNGTATAGSDYTSTTQTVSFANGDTADKAVNVPILDDTIFEGNETVNLTLSTPTGGATLGSPSAAVLTIVDNDNPVPALTSLAPGSATAGGSAFTLTVNGSNFISSSSVRWNGAARTTTFVSSAQVTAAIPATDIASAGTTQVTVVNPAPGGGTSNALSFTITASGTTYLSDLAWVSATNGWGPVERDMSNGDLAAGDGLPLRIRGVTYAKGLGTHAASDITYALNGQYATFLSDVGIDDEEAGHGSVVFQVWVDGVKLYDSGVVTGNTAVRSATVDVTGKNTLRLVVTDGGDNINSDHGDWANARLLGSGTANPIPALTTLSPSSATAGGTAFTLTVNGSNFISSSSVRWNGAARTTTFVSSAQVTAAIPATDIATAGTAQVTVVNPAPGGGTSNALTFTINAAAGSLQFSSSAYSVNENGGSAAITITRAGGSAGAVGVTFSTSNGTATAGSDYTVTTQTVSFANGDSASKTVSVVILDDTLVEGNETVNLTLSSPTGGATLGSPSTAVLTIVDNDTPNPLPALTSLSPSSATAGGAAFTLTVNGSNFISSSSVRWNGAARTTTFVSSAQVTAAIPATDIASAGTTQVTVVNPAPGGGTSNALTFTINADTTPPDTNITSTPSNPSNSSSASFSFTSTEAGSFQCQLDGGTVVACASPQNYTGLGQGSHTFQVQAIDLAGNIDPTPAIYTWTIDTIAPDTTLTGAPSNPSNSSSASFSFISTEAGSFQCQLDGASFAACTSPKIYTGLTQGSHTFQVRAIDAAGNVDPTPASYTWTYTPVTLFPSGTVILTGSLQGGTAASLNADDNNYYALNSTTSGTPLTTAWYGSFTGVSSNLSNLKVTYKGKNSRNCTQTIAIWRWTDSTWVQLDSRTVGTSEVQIANLIPTGTLSDYVSPTGELRVRVRCTRTSGTFVTSGDQMQIVFDIP